MCVCMCLWNVCGWMDGWMDGCLKAPASWSSAVSKCSIQALVWKYCITKLLRNVFYNYYCVSATRLVTCVTHLQWLVLWHTISSAAEKLYVMWYSMLAMVWRSHIILLKWITTNVNCYCLVWIGDINKQWLLCFSSHCVIYGCWFSVII